MSILTMIDGIDKLILAGTNYATIKPRLIDLRDHAKALDDEVSVTKIKHDQLQAKYDRLASDSQQQIADLQAQISKLKTENVGVVHGELDETEVKILVWLSGTPNQYPASIIGAKTGISNTKAEFLCVKLAESDYLCDFIYMGAPIEYQLSQKGREYLVKHNLV